VTAGGNKEELEQRISAALLEGGPAVLLDNFNNITLRSASLDSALTKRPSKVRQFRTLELVTVNTLASVFITGNGVLLAQDTVRRYPDRTRRADGGPGAAELSWRHSRRCGAPVNGLATTSAIRYAGCTQLI
jgi:hypothetical protein